jgi:hypothetical protein
LSRTSSEGNISYVNYGEDKLLKAIIEVQNGRMSEREAASTYGVPRSTMKDRLADRVTRETAGRPTVLSKGEEELIVERLLMLGKWGFPLMSADQCHVIQAYLDAQGRTTRFVENMPGLDFVSGFLQRHAALTVRKANLVKRSRAEVSQDTVRDFFAKFEDCRGHSGFPHI